MTRLQFIQLASPETSEALEHELYRAVSPPLSELGCRSKTASTGNSSPRHCRAPLRKPQETLAHGPHQLSHQRLSSWVDVLEQSSLEEHTAHPLHNPPTRRLFARLKHHSVGVEEAAAASASAVSNQMPSLPQQALTAAPGVQVALTQAAIVAPDLELRPEAPDENTSSSLPPLQLLRCVAPKAVHANFSTPQGKRAREDEARGGRTYLMRKCRAQASLRVQTNRRSSFLRDSPTLR